MEASLNQPYTSTKNRKMLGACTLSIFFIDRLVTSRSIKMYYFTFEMVIPSPIGTRMDSN